MSITTLRLWEEMYGLLAPRRSSGGTRLYSDADVQRAHYIRTLVRERGYSLSAVASAVRDGGVHVAVVAEVHDVLRGLVRADSGWHGAVALVEGAKALTGVGTAALGLYLRWRESLLFIVTALAGGIRRLGGTPINVAEFPSDWQEAIESHQPCSDSDLFQRELPGSIAKWIRETRTRSFHAEPLTTGSGLIGVLMIGSPNPGGISDKAREVCERLALPAGPALRDFAAQF